MAQRKIWKPEEKLAIVMDGFRGRPVKDICREYGVSEAQYYKWRDEALVSCSRTASRINAARHTGTIRWKRSAAGF